MQWTYSKYDVAAVKKLISAQDSDPFFQLRKKRNVDRDRPPPSEERIWMAMVGCLLTTQQRAGPGYPVNRFLNLDPFPLKYDLCAVKHDLEAYVRDTITAFGGIRMAPTIAKRVNENLGRLEAGLFKRLLNMLSELELRRDKMLERSTARMVDIELVGFGPKQSRSLIQWLGSTVYEIPVDSRLIKWMQDELSLEFLDPGKLSYLSYYERVLDLIQELCNSADVLPCLFDAAVFSSYDEGGWSEDILRSSMLHGA